MIVLAVSTAFAASATYYKNLSGGINGKQNTAKVKKEAAGSARNEVSDLSRSLGSSDPIIAKVRYGANGNPVTAAGNFTSESTYTMAYQYNEKGKVGKTYLAQMMSQFLAHSPRKLFCEPQRRKYCGGSILFVI